jgi:hypothetical protein
MRERETHTVPGHVLAVPLDARSCWDSLIYPVYYNVGHVYTYIQWGNRRRRRKKKKGEENPVYVWGLFLQGEGYTQSHAALSYSIHGRSFSRFMEKGAAAAGQRVRERERGG